MNYAAGDGPSSVCASDLDSDGDVDLAVAIRYSGYISIFLGNGDGTFAAAGNYDAGYEPGSVCASDLDSDGHVDLAVANRWWHTISILINLSESTTDATIPPLPVPVPLVIETIYPNPFNPHTTIIFSLPQAVRVHLAIYDVRGSLVRTLIDSNQSAGEKVINWDGLNENGVRVSSGVYFCRLKTAEETASKKMVLLR